MWEEEKKKKGVARCEALAAVEADTTVAALHDDRVPALDAADVTELGLGDRSPRRRGRSGGERPF